MIEAFTPDFYLPEQDLYLEVTVMKQSLVTRKNRKLRKLRELYPGGDVKLFYKRDIERLAQRYRLGAGLLAPEPATQRIGEVYLSAEEHRGARRASSAPRSRATTRAASRSSSRSLKAAIVFLADLSRALPIRTSSTSSSSPATTGNGGGGGRVRLLKDLDASIDGRDVLIVEDVVDTGLTLNYLVKTLALREPALARGGDAPRPPVPAPRRRPAGPLRRLHGAGRVLRRLRLRPRRPLAQPARTCTSLR